MLTSSAASGADDLAVGTQDWLTTPSAHFGDLPLAFERNEGQTNPIVDFVARGDGYSMFLTPTGAVLALQSGESRDVSEPTTTPITNVLRIELVGGNQAAVSEARSELPGKSNYFVGNDPAAWQTGVAQFERVHYDDVYTGIDLEYYGNQGKLEYDFIVAPGGDSAQIRMHFDGADELEIAADGSLIVHLPGGDLVQQPPVAYQSINGEQHAVAAQFQRLNDREIGFSIGSYDSSKSLVIDPVLAYSRFIGGSSADEAYDVVIDAAGNAFITGMATSLDFPTTAGAQDNTYGNVDGFVVKLDATGTTLLYATYLGSNTGSDKGHAIVIDSAGNAYITGETHATNFPTTPNAFQPAIGWTQPLNEAFMTKLNPSGSALVYSTYIAAATNVEEGNGIALDAAGLVYVSGRTASSDFPVKGAMQPTNGGSGLFDAFVMKFNTSLSGAASLLYSTYLGGHSSDGAAEIAVAPGGIAYIVGPTQSTNFPTVNAWDTVLGSSGAGQDVILAKIDTTVAGPAGLLYSTYFGGAFGDDVGIRDGGIDLDPNGFVYITGVTSSTDFPTTPGALQTTLKGTSDAFVAKFDMTKSGAASLVWSTYLGGLVADNGTTLDVDNAGTVYVTGFTGSADFPKSFCAPAKAAANDAFLTRLSGTGALMFSTFLGGNQGDFGFGVMADSAGYAYVVGVTQSSNFPTTPGGDTTLGGFSDAFAAKIDVLACNQPPVVIPDTYLVAEDTTLSVSTPGVLANDSDPEGNNLSISAYTQPVNGLVTMNLDGAFSFTPTSNFCGTDSFTYTASDGQGGSGTASVSVTVSCVNDAPEVVDDSANTVEDNPVTVNVLANDSDVDGDPLFVSAVSQPVNGSAENNGDGTVSYYPNANFCGTDSFTYTASDSQGGSGTASVSVTVSCVNDAPQVVDDSANTLEDNPVTVNVLANDSDVDGDPLFVSAVSQPANGSAEINGDETVSYYPNSNFCGTDSFTYTASDSQGGSGTASVSVTVSCVNDAPQVVDDSANTLEDNPVTVNVLANDSDVDGDPLFVSAVSPPANGSAENNGDGTVSYYPNTNFCGTDSFTYTASDSQGGSGTASVSVTVSCVNDAPHVVDDSANTLEDNPVTVNVLANDSDVDGDPLFVSAVSQPSNGSAENNGDGTVSYYPNANFCGTDSFTYTAGDGQGGSGTASVSVTVSCVNDAPFVVDDSANTLEDNPVTVNVLANDSDVDSDPLFVSAVSQPANGSAENNGDGTVSYYPNANFCGTDSFTYTAGDGQGGSGTASLSVTVSCVNDAPQVVDDSANTLEDNPVTVNVLANDSDVDSDPLFVSAVSQPANGSAEINGDGTVSYYPNANFCGTDSFTYTASDSQGGSGTASVSVTVSCVNDAPVADAGDALSSNEGDSVLFDGNASSDIEGDILDYEWVFGDGSFGSGATPTHVYADNGIYTATLCVTDAHGATSCDSVDVSVLNVEPTVNAEPDATIPAGTAYSGFGSFADPGSDTWTAIVNYGDGSGDQPLALNPDKTFSLAHVFASPGIYTVTVTVTDDDCGWGSDSLIVTVVVSNTPPVFVDASSTSVDCDSLAPSSTVSISAGFTDADISDIHSATIQWGDGFSSPGTIMESGGMGVVTGTHDYATGGIFTVTIMLDDGEGGIESTTVTALVTGARVNGAGVLEIVGTNDADLVHVNATQNLDANAELLVHSSYLAGPPLSFPAAGVTRIKIVLCDGGDHSEIANNITRPSMIDGGRDDDHLKAGRAQANSVLIGGDGDDMLIGGAARDLLIGGTGADRLDGDSDEDILIAGYTAYDANDVSLDAIMAEWTSASSYASRVSHLRGDIAGGLNGSVLLNGDDEDFTAAPHELGSQTVFSDDAVDKLTGASNLDWYFANQDLDGGPLDVITDLKPTDTVSDIDSNEL